MLDVSWRLEIMATLAQFIETEMRKRDMSIRAFAELTGVSHQTIKNIADGKATNPDLKTLVSIARATNVDICTIVSFAAPDDVKTFSPVARMLAEKVSKLSVAQQQVIEGFLLSIALADQSNEAN